MNQPIPLHIQKVVDMEVALTQTIAELDKLMPIMLEVATEKMAKKSTFEEGLEMNQSIARLKVYIKQLR